MSQATNVIPDSNGTDFLANLNAALAAIATQHRGSTRPSYATAGMLWTDSDTDIVYYYDGSDDIPLFRVDATGNIASMSNLAHHDLGTSAGSGTVQTASAAPAITAYATGQLFIVKAGVTNTGGLTLNVNSVGAKSVVDRGGQALAAGFWLAGDTYALRYDGTNLVVLNAMKIVRQVFTGDGTYTPTVGMRYCDVEAVGGGGGGGGTAAATAGNQGGGGGGGGGSYARKRLTAADIGASKAVDIGALGGGGSAGNNAGSAGADTTLGTTLVVGKGGSAGGGATANGSGTAGAGGVAGTGDATVVGQAGMQGGAAALTSHRVQGCDGGNSGLSFGFGGRSGNAAGTGAAGSGYGGGGSGGASIGGTAQAGGDGTAGIMIITEYIG